LPRSLLAVLVPTVTCLVVAACAGGGAETSSVRGLIREVGTDASGRVTSLVVVDSDDREWRFEVDLEPSAYVDAAHLRLHQDQQWAVVVHFRDEGDTRLAYRIDDG